MGSNKQALTAKPTPVYYSVVIIPAKLRLEFLTAFGVFVENLANCAVGVDNIRFLLYNINNEMGLLGCFWQKWENICGE